MPPLNLVLLGFGNVGRSLARLLLRKNEFLTQDLGRPWQVVGIFTSRHGAVIDPDGIDLASALALAEVGDNLNGLSPVPAPDQALAFIRASKGDVLFENSPVNYATGQPAIDHLAAALESGMHAITANKGPVVHAYHDLQARAQIAGRGFYFESTVMDGAPIFSLFRETLPAAYLTSFRGVLNSTTNLILTRMESGEDFESAVKYAQQIGIAETDPSGDTQGWDAAIKVSALVTVLMGVAFKPEQVERQGIEGLTQQDIRTAAAAGKRWKLVCQALRDEQGIRASVRPLQIEAGDPLYHVNGTSSAVTFISDVLGPLTVLEENPGPETTAYGLLADMLNALRES